LQTNKDAFLPTASGRGALNELMRDLEISKRIDI